MLVRTRFINSNGKSYYKTFDFPNKEVYVKSMIKIISNNLINELKMFYNFNLEDKKFLSAIEASYCEKTNFRKIKEFIKNFYPDLSDSVIQKKFWLERGWDENYAKQKVSEFQKKNAKKFVEKYKKDPSIRFTATQLEWWINKGYSLEEAKKLRRKRQQTFSLEKCIEKYGKEKGLLIFQQRQEKWRKSLDAKYSKEEQISWCTKGSLVSQESLNLFEHFYKKLKDKFTCFIGIQPNKEFVIKYKKNFYLYDFTILELKLIFEYQGTHVHPNPKWDKNKWNNWQHCFTKEIADEIQLKYNKKIQAAEAAGFQVIQLWDEDGFDKNYQIISSYLGKF